MFVPSLCSMWKVVLSRPKVFFNQLVVTRPLSLAYTHARSLSLSLSLSFFAILELIHEVDERLLLNHVKCVSNDGDVQQDRDVEHDHRGRALDTSISKSNSEADEEDCDKAEDGSREVVVEGKRNNLNHKNCNVEQ